jgi:hypothetical protein
MSPTILLIGFGIVACITVPLFINNAKLKAKNTKLTVERNNLEYELGRSLLGKKNEELSPDRINSMKERFKQTSDIKPVKQATKKDVEAFYETQKVDKKERANKREG